MENRLRYFLILLLALPMPASAACLFCSCSIDIDSSIAFGNYDPLPGAAQDAAGGFTVSCIAGVGLLGSFTVTLSTGGSGSYSPRKMSSGATNKLNYNLYMDIGRSIIWGDGTGGTSFVNDPSLLNIGNFVKQYDIYGRILANQETTPPGVYTDVVVITVTLN